VNSLRDDLHVVRAKQAAPQVATPKQSKSKAAKKKGSVGQSSPALLEAVVGSLLPVNPSLPLLKPLPPPPNPHTPQTTPQPPPPSLVTVLGITALAMSLPHSSPFGLLSVALNLTPRIGFGPWTLAQSDYALDLLHL